MALPSPPHSLSNYSPGCFLALNQPCQEEVSRPVAAPRLTLGCLLLSAG